MKINGKRISAPEPVVVAIPRGHVDNDLIFKLGVLVNQKDFEKRCPEPQPDHVVKPDGSRFIDMDSPAYHERIAKYNTLRFDWMIINSLNATPGMEWEKVKINEPDTWNLYEEELQDSGLTKSEINYLVNKVIDANTVDDKKAKEARDRFFAKAASEQKK